MAPDLSGKLYEFFEFIHTPQSMGAYQNVLLCKTDIPCRPLCSVFFKK